MKEVIQAFFRERSLANHQLASYNDCIPSISRPSSRMERIARSIRIGAEEEHDPTDGGMIHLDVIDQTIAVRMRNVQLGTPTIKEANGAEHEASPMECRLRKLTYSSPIRMDFTLYKEGIALPEEKGVVVGQLPIMVRSNRCNVHAEHIAGDRVLDPDGSKDDEQQYLDLLRKNGEDPLDPGGYFIVNGTERVLISSEDLAPNRVTIEENKRYTKTTEVAKIFSQKDGFRAPLNVEKRRDGMFVVKISAAGGQAIPVVLLMKALGMATDGDIFKAAATSEESFKYIVANINDVKENKEYEVETTEEAIGWLEKKFAAGQQKEYRELKINQLLDRNLLPHLGDQHRDRKKKAIYLGRIVRQILDMAISNKQPNDKDHYANKRVRLAGDLIEDLFRISLQNLARDLKYQLERHHNRKRELKINSCLRPDVLTSKIMHALATGNWVNSRSGVSQLLDRTSYISALSHMRRVTSPLVRSQPHFEARDLHPTQWGRLCPNETPEGQNCGLVKNLAMMVDVSEEIPPDKVFGLLEDLGVESIEGWSDGSRIHVNGDIFGIHHKPVELVKQFKSARRRGIIRAEVSIRHDVGNSDIFINTDRGRILRPLLILEDGNLRLTREILDALKAGENSFSSLVTGGVIEWVDAEEEEDLHIAPRPYELPDSIYVRKTAKGYKTVKASDAGSSDVQEYNLTHTMIEWLNIGKYDASHALLKADLKEPNNTQFSVEFKVPLNFTSEESEEAPYTHVEIDPQLILGVCASLIPYPEHNSTPRVTGGTAMVKQSLGLPSANLRLRPDTRGHNLHYPQTPLLRTQGMDQTNFMRRPGGQNFVVAIAAHHGYNMQDAIIINSASVARGLGRSTFIRTYNAERRRFPGGQVEEIEVPGHGEEDVKGLKEAMRYAHLEPDGLPKPEEYLEGGDVLVGKTSPPRFLEETVAGGAFLLAQERRESSMLVRHGEKGHIDNVIITESLDSGRLIRLMVRSNRIPELGDKFASRHGQKGVIGRLVKPEDLPFTVDGVIPDLVMNPHAIPSRMTVAHVMEMIGGKVGSMEGRSIDGTAFSGEKESALRQGLLRNGFAHSGRERMVNGETGEEFDAEIYIGCIYYQKLHHMVSGKLHSRSRGRVQILTRQPTEGRARQGGLRFGEMERDCLIAHGASMVIKDRLLDESDGVDLYVCSESGHVAWFDPKKNNFVSPIHGEGAEVHKIQTSYAFKLLLDEMKSLGVAMRLEVEER